MGVHLGCIVGSAAQARRYVSPSVSKLFITAEQQGILFCRPRCIVLAIVAKFDKIVIPPPALLAIPA